MHSDFLRRINADTDLVTLHTQHGDGHIVADHEGFTNPSCKY
jgi:hypothetical protein